MRQLARHHDALLVAAAQRRRGDLRARRGDRILLEQLRHAVPRPAPIHGAAAKPRIGGRRTEHEVLGERHLGNETFSRSVFRDERDGFRHLATPTQRDDPSRDGPQQLALAVALDCRDAHDLTRPDDERCPAQRDPESVVARDVERLHLNQRRCARIGTRACGGRRSAGGRRALADHGGRERRPIQLPGGRGQHDFSSAQHRHAIRGRQRFGQFVRDEHRGAAGRGESANHIEQLIHLGRRQHRGGLVEEKNRTRRPRAPSRFRAADAGRR